MEPILTEFVTEAVVGPSEIFDSKSSPSGPLNVVTGKTIAFRGVPASRNVDTSGGGGYMQVK